MLRKFRNRVLLWRKDPMRIGKKIKRRHLTYLSEAKLVQLIESLSEINDAGIEGRLVEAGCALGGSLVLISTYSAGREISVFDTFEMIPPPGPEDPADVHERYETIVSGQSAGIGGETYYGYRGDLRGFVTTQINELVGADAQSRITFNKGLLQDTMHLNEPIAFAHIDVDWYDPVKTSLMRLWPLMPIGGIIIFDDYFDWGGCKKAVDEFFEQRDDMKFDGSSGNMKLTKIA